MLSHRPFHHFLQFAWKNSAFYRRLYRAHGIGEADLEHVALHELPVVTKRMILEAFDEVVTDPRISNAALEAWLEHDHDPRSRFLGEFLVIHSSGSSGVQASIVYNETAWRSMTAAAAAHLFPGSLPAGVRYRNAFYIGERGHVVSATTAMNSSRAAFDRLVVSMQDPAEETIARLNDFQPDRLTSYPSSLGWLAELALDGKLRIAPKDVLASAERMTPAVEAKLRQAWNPAIYDLYAAAESLFIATRQPGKAEWKVLDELQTLEVLDANNHPVGAGQMGRAVLTNWTNRTLPLIRYDLTDYVICGETQPGSSTLGGFVGRSFEALPIRLDNGEAGEIPSYVLANFCAGLEGFQFVSSSPDEVEVQYCAPQDLDELLRPRLGGLLAEWGGGQTKFSLRRVDHIWNNTANFKLKLVRRADEPQVGLPAAILSPSPAGDPAEQFRPGEGFVPFRRGLLEESIVSIFERQAAARPGAAAVQDGGLELTYAGLNRAANRTAKALRTRGMDPAHPVALLFSHKAAMITAMLGVLKAGGWYAPLDPSHPVRRNTAILGEIGAGLVLTDDEGLPTARDYGFRNEQVVNLDEMEGSGDETNPCLPTSPDAPACILYTSGSTGQPKGVVLDQRAVLHRAMLYTNDYAIGPGDRLALLQSYVFNASVREIYAALLNGAGLYLYALKRDGVHHLAAWLEEKGITVLYMVPSTWRVFLDTLKCPGQFERLRLVRLGGEAVLARDVAGFQSHFGPGCMLANGLASTETGTICQYFINHHTRVGGGQAPVGFAVQDKEVSLLDEEGRPVKAGETGEIVVASAYLGPGYFTPPGEGKEGPGFLPRTAGQKTRIVHTGDLGYCTPDGRMVLVGRKDWQVKLRGQRINLLEIEQALLSLENVADAAVTLQTSQEGPAFLAAYIQPGRQPAPAEDALRRGLRALLPEVMLPAVFLFFEQLPRTPGGKVDHQALPAASRSSAARPAAPAPETAAERALAEIWGELLGIKDVGPADSFFDLGGDSLAASAMIARVESRFARRIPLSVLFQYETLGGLAGYITGEDGTRPHGRLVTIQPLGHKPPVFFMPGLDGEVLGLRDLADKLGSERPLYGLQMSDFGSSAESPKTIEQAAEQFKVVVQNACPHGGPYTLIGYSFGGHLALETARQLAVLGDGGPLVVLLDTYPPVPYHRPTLPERHILFHINNLLTLHGAWEVADYFYALIRRIIGRLVHRRPAWASIQQPVIPFRPVVPAALAALSAYKPLPYPGKVVLFKASQREHLVRDPRERWKEFISSQLEIRMVPGDHSSLIKSPQTIELARQLQEILPG